MLHHLVLSLSVHIHLQVERDWESANDTEVGAHSVPKSTCEQVAMKGGDNIWNTIFADHIFQTHISRCCWVNLICAAVVGHNIRQMVDNYQDPEESHCDWLLNVSQTVHDGSFPGMG